MMREVLVILHLRSGDDDESGGDLTDDEPVENNQIADRYENHHHQEVHKGVAEGYHPSQPVFQGEDGVGGVRDCKQEERYADDACNCPLASRLWGDLSLDGLGVIRVAPDAGAEGDHEEEYVTCKDGPVD